MKDLTAEIAKFTPGSVVEVLDDWVSGQIGKTHVYHTANVVRVTKTQLVVVSARGHEMRFRLKDLKVTGYHFVHYAFSVRAKAD